MHRQEIEGGEERDEGGKGGKSIKEQVEAEREWKIMVNIGSFTLRGNRERVVGARRASSGRIDKCTGRER